jgi:uncharacterized zinc-type alcohol dehydrogenase-like protein
VPQTLHLFFFVAATKAALDSFETMDLERHDVGDDDVGFDLAYCGMCHTDVHFAQNDMGVSQYPLVLGHELIGVVNEVGKNAAAKGYAVGDKVAVGCLVDSCLSCAFCDKGEEMYCAKGMVGTYGSTTQHGRAGPNGKQTMGGYSTKMVVNERFLIRVPEGAHDKLDKAAPLLCAGITMYDPLMEFGVKPGMKVGIAGLGGLGQMGVKLAHKMGAEVTAISTTSSKEARAKEMGADHFLLSTDAAAMQAAAGTLDLILDTVSACHDSDPYAALLATKGTLVCIGLQTSNVSVGCHRMLFKRINVTGSLIGGIQRTQEMIDFCVKNDIYPEVQVINASEIPEKLQLLNTKNDTIVRYVIDCKTI